MSELQQSDTQATAENEGLLNDNQVTQEAPENNAATNEQNLLELVSEDLRAEPSLKDFKDINSLAKSYVNAQKLIGNSVRIPSEDASQEAKAEFLNKLKSIDDVVVKPTSDDPSEREEFLNKLGRPESPDQYDFNEVVDPNIVQHPDVSAELDTFKNIAHEIGITKEQANKLVDMRMQTLKEHTESQKQQVEEAKQELRGMWGQDYENRMNIAKQTAKLYSEKYPDAMTDLINGPTGSNPAFINMLAELGKGFKEQGHVGLQKAQFGTSPDEALSKISEKRSDAGFMKAYTDERHPGHSKAVKELNDLYKLAHGVEE